MKIRPYILLADKKTKVYEPERMYSQSEVYGIVFSDITGEHIRVLSPKEIQGQRLLESGIEMPDKNVCHNIVDALFDFNGHINTYEFENAGSDVVKTIKEQFGNEWFIPSLGELIPVIHYREIIDFLLSYIKDSYRISKSMELWTSSIYDNDDAYYCYTGNGYIGSSSFKHALTVIPITLLPE